MQIAEPQGAASTPVTGERASARRRTLPQFRISHASDLAAISLLLLLIALVSWDRLWSPASFADGDVRSFFIPWYAYMGEHIRHLDVPGWMPHILSGMPFAAEPESGWGYLPAMLSFALLPPLLAYQVFFIMQLLLAAMSTYVLARLIGFRALGSFAAAAAWTFSGSVGVAGCCTIFSELAAWLPVALVGVELTCRAQRWSTRLGWIVFTGVAISQVLSGWVGQGSYYGLLVIGSYFVFRAILVPPKEGRALFDRIVNLGLSGTLSFAFGFGLAAAALWPRLDNVSQTYLGSSAYRSTTWCEPDCGRSWYVLLKTLVSQQGYWYPYYIGGAVLACATFGLFELARRRELFFFAGLAAAVFMLAMNTANIHPLFYALPEFEGLHKHATLRIFILLPFPLAIFVGAAVDGFNRIVRNRWALGFPLIGRFVWWAAVLAVPVASLEIAPFTRRAYLLAWSVICAGVLLARPWTRHRLPWLIRVERVLPVVLILLVLWDPTGRRVIEDPRNHVWYDQARESLKTNISSTDPGGAGAFLQNEQSAGERFRYYGYVSTHERNGLPFLFNNRAIPLGLEDIQGYNPGKLERYWLFFQALNQRSRNYHTEIVLTSGPFSPLIDLLSTRYIIVPVNVHPGRPDLLHLSQRYKTVYTTATVRILENKHAYPRAWIVHAVTQSSPSDALDLLAQGKVDPRAQALIEIAPPNVQNLPQGAEDQVAIAGYGDDSITLTATAAADGFLVLSEVFNPGWNVKIDGQPAEIYQTDYLLRGVAVPKGTHEIVFTYQPESLTYGIYLTLATSVIAVSIALWVCLTWLDRTRRAKRRTHLTGEDW